MLDKGISVTINSDDPAYFGGYMNANYLATTEGLGLSSEQVKQLAINSFSGSFLPKADKALHIASINHQD